MRNVYTHPRPITRQNANYNLQSNPFSMSSIFDDFTYDREYQNAILASIQEFEETPIVEEESIDTIEHWDDMLLENINSDDDDDEDDDMFKVD